MFQYPTVHVVHCLQWHLLRPPCISAGAVTSQHVEEGSKQAWLMWAVKVILTWCPCKQYREQVDAYSDGIESWKSSETIGDGVRLWRSVSETCLVLPVKQRYTAKVNQIQEGDSQQFCFH